MPANTTADRPTSVQAASKQAGRPFAAELSGAAVTDEMLFTWVDQGDAGTSGLWDHIWHNIYPGLVEYADRFDGVDGQGVLARFFETDLVDLRVVKKWRQHRNDKPTSRVSLLDFIKRLLRWRICDAMKGGPTTSEGTPEPISGEDNLDDEQEHRRAIAMRVSKALWNARESFARRRSPRWINWVFFTLHDLHRISYEDLGDFFDLPACVCRGRARVPRRLFLEAVADEFGLSSSSPKDLRREIREILCCER